MKKLITIILILALAMPAAAALAEIPDISGLTFDELRTLRGKIQWAMWACEEWKEVEVPAGVYKIGEDIPAGKWQIQTPSYSTIEITYGTKLNSIETNIDDDFIVWRGHLTLDLTMDFIPHHIDMNLEEGNYIHFSGKVLFYPYEGSPKLDFN